MRHHGLRSSRVIGLLPPLLILVAAGFARADDADDLAFFEAKVRPILVARCYECHSAEGGKVRGGLRLDSRVGWTKGGDTGPAILPGDTENSPLVLAIGYDDIVQMPPKGKLPEAEIATLTEWVRRGAPDPRTEVPVATKKERTIDIAEGKTYWAFQPLAKVDPPQVVDGDWCRTPIDRFILAKLEEQGIAPSPRATPRQLVRRAYFDLIGLPPTPEEVAAFEADPSDAKYADMVGGLLQSPHHGERWARHWLDLARFAESHGFEHDYDRPTAYHYRDFVIEAFNRDLPYDTFVKWQLAGDEYEPDNNLALKATGFLGAGVHSTQITANQVEKERYDELDDILNITGTAFLGLTFGCARCHDHKFDPIPTADYYRMLSTFTTTVRTEVELVSDPAGHREALAKYEAEHAPYVEALTRFEKDELPGRLARWEAARVPDRGKPEWVVLEPIGSESAGGATFETLDDRSLKAVGNNAEFDVYTLKFACELPEITAIRVEALTDPSLVGGGPGRAANGNFDLTGIALKVVPRYGIGATTEPPLINPKATFEQTGLPIAAVLDGDENSGWAVDPQFGKDHAAVFELGHDCRTDSGATLTLTLKFHGNTGHNIGRVRVSATSSPRPVGLDDDGIPKKIAEVLAVAPADRTPDQADDLRDWYRTIDTTYRSLARAIEDHARTAPKADGTKAMICSEGLPALRLHTQGADFLPATHFLRRGDPNQKQGEASQGFLQVLMPASDSESHWQAPPPEGSRTSYRRRAMAEWMTDVDDGAGALLARVIVNRLWQHHFGRGLVATPSDFGAQGTPPSHPELLDWLAGELIRGGWKLKPIHQMIMTSAVYMQSSAIDEARAAKDVDNLLLWRQDRRRLEAEPIRDAMLAVSGLLDTRMFGPGTLDEAQRRRSIYFTVKRSKLIPMMMLFDAPDALVGLGQRSTTTIAPQALLILNSPYVREWSVAFARRVRPVETTPVDESIRSAYRVALAREPVEAELSAARAFVAREAESRRATDSAASDADLQALADFCQALIASNEFIYID